MDVLMENNHSKKEIISLIKGGLKYAYESTS